jgi:hypothetical protein
MFRTYITQYIPLLHPVLYTFMHFTLLGSWPEKRVSKSRGKINKKIRLVSCGKMYNATTLIIPVTGVHAPGHDHPDVLSLG